MRILVVGAGSTGGYLGARLVQAGRDVTFLVRPGRAAQLRADGLRVTRPHGDVRLAPALALAGALDGSFDVVLLAVKAMALEQTIADMAPAIGPGTTILPVLNGMRCEPTRVRDPMSNLQRLQFERHRCDPDADRRPRHSPNYTDAHIRVARDSASHSPLP